MLDGPLELLVRRDVTLAALGGAYLAFLANLVAAIACFMACRSWLVVSPNRAAKHYALYVVMVLAAVGIATFLENELVDDAALHYATLPHLLLLAMLHLWIYHRQEPWLIVLGASALVGAGATAAAAALLGERIGIAHFSALGLLGALVVYLAHYSVATKRGFVNAKSIYLSSKERPDDRPVPQKPWLGLVQWIALIAASAALAVVNSLLRGSEISAIPAVDVASESTVLLAVTAFVCAVPATVYWLAHRNWMPELTRFVWLVWLVVGFAFTYGNILTSFDRV